MKKKTFLWITLAVMACLAVVSTVLAVDWDVNERWPSSVRTFQPANAPVPIYDTTWRGHGYNIPESKAAAEIRTAVIEEMKKAEIQ